jgi:hypothetical protein
MRVAVLTCALAGCAYNPGSFTHIQVQFAGHQMTVGCLDLAIDRRPDLPSGDAVVGYAFGNRCDHPTAVDLLAVNVIGRTADGREVELLPYDPRHDIQPLEIDGRLAAKEAIAYPSTVPLVEVCIDVASITHAKPARWLCVGGTQPQTAQVEAP